MRIIDALQDFIVSGCVSNVWISGSGMKVYIRHKAVHWVLRQVRTTLDIANIEVSSKRRGRGLFKKFLILAHRLHGLDGTFVENVHNERLANFFRKNQWEEVIDEGGVSSFFCPSSCHPILGEEYK